METWKKIPNFSRYEASNKGNLRSLNYKCTGKIKVLKPAVSTDGYLKTMILDDCGKYRSWTVHKFVCLAFLGQVPEGKEVNHKNGIKTDNRIENLEYCTRSENIKHAYLMGLEKPLRGSKNGNSKLTEKDVKEIRNFIKGQREKGVRYYGRKELASKYGVSEGHIKALMNDNNTLWYHV